MPPKVMGPITLRAFADELRKMASSTKPYKIKSNDRFPPRTKSNVEALKQRLESWDSPHREEALGFMHKVTPEGLFDILHSTRRWYSGGTMAHKLKEHQPALRAVMNLEPTAVNGIYRGIKVPDDNPLAKLRPGDFVEIPVTRNRGVSSWSTSEDATNRFSGRSKGKTGLVLKLKDTEGVTPILAPPSHTAPWFNALYEHTIGKSFRPKEGEYLIAAPSVKVEVVRVKK